MKEHSHRLRLRRRLANYALFGEKQQSDLSSIHPFAHNNEHILFPSQEQMLFSSMTLLSVKLLNSVSFQKTSSITLMLLELEHSPCTTPLIAPLNASAILHAFLLTWPPPQEKMENFGAICCLLIGTEASENTMKT